MAMGVRVVRVCVRKCERAKRADGVGGARTCRVCVYSLYVWCVCESARSRCAGCCVRLSLRVVRVQEC